MKDTWFDFFVALNLPRFGCGLTWKLGRAACVAAGTGIELALQAPIVLGGFFCTGTRTGVADVVCHHWPRRFLRAPVTWQWIR